MDYPKAQPLNGSCGAVVRAGLGLSLPPPPPLPPAVAGTYNLLPHPLSPQSQRSDLSPYSLVPAGYMSDETWGPRSNGRDIR